MKTKKQSPAKEYLTSLWHKFRQNGIVPGWILVLTVIAALLISWGIEELFKLGTSSLAYITMVLMYGTSSWTIYVGLLEIVLGLLLSFLLAVGVYYILVTLQYQLQDTVIAPQKKITWKSVWQQFRRLNLNQQLRLSLYLTLFIFLWQVPFIVLEIIFSSHQIVEYILLVASVIVLIYKELDYSQAIFLYREYQPKFLGQSLRYALTASRRFLDGSRKSLLKVVIFLILPVVIWDALWSMVLYFGFYFWEPIMIYGGPVIGVLGICFYLPVVMLVLADFYETARTKEVVELAFRKLFKPQKHLTGEDYPVRSPQKR